MKAAVKRLAARWFPGRYAVPGIMLLTFVVISLLTRLALLAFNQDAVMLAPRYLLPILLIGTWYDLAVAAYWMLPFALFAWLAPDSGRWRKIVYVVGTVLVVVCLAIWVFVAASELFFWNEFSTRFNFIAVDYLIYTREVIGNIGQSYNLKPVFAALIVILALLLWLLNKPLRRALLPAFVPLRRRSVFFVAYPLLAIASFLFVDAGIKEFTSQAQAVQLAANGQYEFFRAFRTNEIDYEQFYKTLPQDQAAAVLRKEIAAGREVEFSGNPLAPFERHVTASGAEKRLNVVLISVESLSADFMAAFGNSKGITPFLDKLAGESLFFTHLYATGTRTVRGLEALSVGLPPTPGYSVVKRPHNENLFTVGNVLAGKGYEPMFLYGGYGYFDNMNYFYGNNGYTVVDRVALAASEIHHETIWGVADEDLFTLTLRELDKRHQKGKPFFAQVMTTSNHRPYTYPADRIDIPSGLGRDGAVKYTDWALGDFMARARKKPWFDDTVFVIVADHCSSSRGTTDIPIERFHIPLFIYAPKHIAARRVDSVASQIDVAPTILALLNMSYTSRFFGQDILSNPHPRALMANYQTVAYMADDVLVELRPKATVRVVKASTGEVIEDEAKVRRHVDAAIAYYQSASQSFGNGGLKLNGR